MSRALPLAGLSSGVARKLQQSSQGSTSMAYLLADLGTELGTGFTTQALTVQSVDLLTVRRQGKYRAVLVFGTRAHRAAITEWSDFGILYL